MKISRRRFLQVSAAAGGGLLVSFVVPKAFRGAEPDEAGGGFLPNAWLRILPDDKAYFRLDRVEMGQGVMTALPMILAEELDWNPARLIIESAPAEPRYANPRFKIQITGGSTSVAESWLPLRRAGAIAREMLMQAAARRWGVDVATCSTRDGVVLHPSSSRQASYGELAAEAAKLKAHSGEPKLRERRDFQYVGQSLPRLDNLAKVTGAAGFGIDVKVEGMLTAVLIRPPHLGDRLVSFSDAEAKASPGFQRAFSIPQGVAVVATGYWEARQAAGKVRCQWETPAAARELSSATLASEYQDLAKQSGKSSHRRGDFESAFAAAASRVEATYEMPFLAHATMEPQNFTAHVTDTKCELWGPTQGAGLAQQVAATITGLPHAAIHVHTTFVGGGFGRRLEQDYVAEAVYVSREMKAPVKVIWSREDDMKHDFYRPASRHQLRAGLDAAGKPVAQSHRIVAQSILGDTIPKWLPALMPSWIPGAASGALGSAIGGAFPHLTVDSTAVEGAAVTPYLIDNQRNEFVRAPSRVPIGFWRSVGHSYNGFVVECFIDELATAAKRDPLEFRRSLLEANGRHRRVLELAAEKAGWSGARGVDGLFRGIAQHASFGSFAAQVADVRVSDKTIEVKRVVCAIDCGLVVNPDLVRAQVESAVIFGLSAALYGEIGFEGGGVRQSNFHDYQVVRMPQAPKIEVHLMDSAEAPSGVGEVGVPPIGPAVANAVFAATGQRLRRMPLQLN